MDGEVRFPCLLKLMPGLLTIPDSNANSERGFSILKKIHTDQRPSVSTLTEELLTECKKVISKDVQKNSNSVSQPVVVLHCGNVIFISMYYVIMKCV